MRAEDQPNETSVVYHAPPQRGLPLVSALIAAAFGVGIFVAFAVFQVQPVEPELKTQLRELVAVEKPPPPVKQPPPPEKKAPAEDTLQVQVKPDLQVPVPPLQLNQLNVKLVPEFNTRLAGNFGLDFQTLGPGVGNFEVFDLSEVDGQPRALFVPRPTYPASLRKSGISGRVVVACVIDSEGNARNLSIHESTHRAFNNAALNAISRARFQPATNGGKPVAVNAHIPFRFEVPAS
ncbi:MAG: energy transducer TonB [Limisphaerales bacterium]